MYTLEEQSEHRRQWIEALRSGNYKQGTGTLRAGDNYCCLGVACEVSELGKWVPLNADENEEKPILADTYLYLVDGEIAHGGYLPEKVMDWLGVSNNGVYVKGVYSNDNFHETLIVFNDGGYSFGIIADMIEDGEIVVKT